jgi:antibiotic biosynthesis monooxygenase (ABM) superfamily enzyme
MRDDRLDNLSHEERLKLLESQGAFQYGKDSDQSVETLGQLHIVSKHLHNISRWLRVLCIAIIVYVVISLLNFLVHL